MTEEIKNKLNKTHAVDKVYAKVDGGNDEITLDEEFKKIVDAVLNNKKIPVTTVNHNRMESHYVFDKADETDAKTE